VLRKRFPFMAAVALLFGCVQLTAAQSITANPAPSAPSEPATSPQSSSTNSTTSSAVSAPSGYQLSGNDSIMVEVFGEDDLKTAARLNSDGMVSLPLIGAVRLGGLTLTQATARVTELYAKDYLVHPKVNVTLLSYAKRRFTVLGQVNHPGSFEMPETSPGGIDLLEAIAIAGGYTRIAAPERISVRRNTGKGDQLLRVDGKKLARGEGGGFKVQSGDTITVGESIF
jgi:protein involved in polysaccharide export with SLBB domain